MNKAGGGINIAINGYQVSATFSDSSNTTVLNQIKQILVSSFADHVPKDMPDKTLAIPSDLEDNSSNHNSHVP